MIIDDIGKEPIKTTPKDDINWDDVIWQAQHCEIFFELKNFILERLAESPHKYDKYIDEFVFSREAIYEFTDDIVKMVKKIYKLEIESITKKYKNELESNTKKYNNKVETFIEQIEEMLKRLKGE